MTNRRLPLHVHITTLFLALISVFGVLLGTVSYLSMERMLSESAREATSRIAGQIVGDVERIAAPADAVVSMLSFDPIAQATSLPERLKRVGVLRQSLEMSPHLSSVYVGYESGDFFMLRRLMSDQERQRFNAPDGTRFVVQSIEQTAGGGPLGRYLFLDITLKQLGSELRPEYAAGFDVRTRDWFVRGITSFGLITTSPYLFYSNRLVGVTFARRMQGGEGVVGADITLKALSTGLASRKVTPGTQLALVNDRGRVIAHENESRLFQLSGTTDAKPQLTELERLGVTAFSGLAGKIHRDRPIVRYSNHVTRDHRDWYVSLNRVSIKDARPLYLAMAIPDDELFAEAIALRNTSVMITLLLIVLAVPLTWALARAVSKSLRQLLTEADAIRHFNFDAPVRLSTNITEVDELAQTMGRMKETIRRFLDITHAVAAEERFEALLPMLLQETIAAAGARGGILYLADQDQLTPAAAWRGGQSLVAAELPAIQLASLPDPVRQVVNGLEVLCCRSRDVIAGLPDGWLGDEDYVTVLPLANRRHDCVGVMVLLRETEMPAAQLAFVRALSGTASSSLEARELIAAQKSLFESFIRMIASAIDAKSPYTGGHCARVPELTKMLARAAEDSGSGAYAEFSLSEAEWEAVHVAGWLHDCGKVTTPEYVVDKATKLESIYDRIHEVRMRFEVLKRDAEIASLRRMASGAHPDDEARRLADAHAELDEEFAFVATCNEGGEFMAPEKVERLRRIAGRTWLRTLDDRVGISHEERERKAALPAAALPVWEMLLADKPEHIITRQPRDQMPPDNPWGFKLNVPEHLYNRGELYNLSIGRGTLTAEDRYKINEHIVQTIIMLQTLPFPKHLRQVPELAGGHHEKMDGTGYPRGLKAHEMSPVARMMAIADIFEALTAVDRPYKEGKKLSEAVRIMMFMSKDNHIDPDLFALFLRSGVYLDYAKRYLKPEQIDLVDVDAVLSGQAGGH
ncbi:HD domain-containing phosphohydrolase [Chitinibacteraceae bacterium HSL-7]